MVPVSTQPTNKYTKEELLAYLVVYTDIFGVPPRRGDIDDLAGPHSRTYLNHFGSWESALETAGVLPDAEGEQ